MLSIRYNKTLLYHSEVLQGTLKVKSMWFIVFSLTRFFVFTRPTPHPLCTILFDMGKRWWKSSLCCCAVPLGNKALVWMGWQVVKISSAWEMSVFPSTLCLLPSIIGEHQTADVFAHNGGSVCVWVTDLVYMPVLSVALCVCVCAMCVYIYVGVFALHTCVFLKNSCSLLLEANNQTLTTGAVGEFIS